MVQVGARADLLLIEESPLTKLDSLRKPLGVMRAGKWWSAADVRAILEQNRQAMDASIRESLRIPAAAP